jgi:hypothetical protein
MFSKLFLSLVCLMMVLGCSNGGSPSSPSTPRDENKIDNIDLKTPQVGFTAQPQRGWFQLDESSGSRIYGKQLDKNLVDEGYSEIARIDGGSLKSKVEPSTRDALEYIKIEKINDERTHGRLTLEHDYFSFVRVKNLDCLRYSQKAKDSAALDKFHKPMTMDIIGLTCVHPKNHLRFIDLEVSSRYSASQAPLPILEDAQLLFNTLKAL